jgi:PAS domain S-box-containing protein
VRDYALILLDRNGCVLTWNAGAQLLAGYSAAEAVGMPLSLLYPSDALERGQPAADLARACTVGCCEDEGWRVRKDGSLFWAAVSLTTLRDALGQPCGFMQIMRDLSERRSRESELRESEERFRLLVQGVRDYAIFTLDPQGHVTSWNAGACRIKGYEPHEIIGSHFSRFYPQDAIERRWPEHELQRAQIEGSFEDEGWRIRKDGSRFWANVIITALRDSSGTLRGFAKVTRDLTERREQEEALRRGEQRFRLLLESVTDHALFLVDTQGVVSSWNEGAQRIVGYSSQQIIGRHIANFYRPGDVAEDRPWRELALAHDTGRLDLEGWRVRQDGSSYWAKVVISALKDEHGELYGYAHLIHDLTRQQHTQALESSAGKINEFLATLAHELRNPLAPIRNAVILMGRKGLADPVLEAMRQTIERQSGHLERIVDELLDVDRIARGGLRLDKGLLDLSQLLAGALEASRPLIERREQQLQVSIPAQPVKVEGDALRLTQVVVNLLNNAAKYTPVGGCIRVALTAADPVELRIRDNGIGIQPEMLGRIFDLFVRDEEAQRFSDRGLGVGLALVRRVVELHGGRVEAHSGGRGCGSEFVVFLPPASTATMPEAAADPAAARAAAIPARRADTLPRRRIVIADDNADAAASLELLLQSFGQDTCVAHDGIAAIEAVARWRPQIVLLDLGMPALDGYQVAQRLRELPGGSALTLVAVTGWSQEADRQRALQSGFDRHLAKPVSETALRELLASAAAAGGAGV